MLRRQRNNNFQILMRSLLVLALMLLSKNVELEIVSTDWQARFITESMPLPTISKLMKLF